MERMDGMAFAASRVRDFRPVEASQPELWAPGVVTFDTGPVHVETSPPLLSLKFVAEGEEYYSARSTLEVRTGQLALVGPKSAMEGGVRPGRTARGFSVFIDAGDLPVAARQPGALDDLMHLAPALERRLENTLASIEGSASGPELAFLIEDIRAGVHDYVEDVFGVGDRLQLNRAWGRQDHAARLLAARRELAMVEEMPRSVEAVGADYGYARTRFSSLFKRAFGETPQHFRDRHRLQNARRLVRKSDLRLHEVAEKAGYPDYPTFSKAYRRMLGVSPSLDRGAAN